MKYYVIFLVVLLFISITAQTSNSLSDKEHHKSPLIIFKNHNGSVPMSAQELKNDPNGFQIAIVADRSGDHRGSIFADAMKKINLLQPEFVMSVGDLIEGYSKNESVINKEWDQMDEFINQLTMPFFYVPGNHDYSNEVMADVWEERYGPSYYHFVYKDVLFTCLNSSDLMNGGEKQIKWAKNIVKENKDLRWNLIFLHHPLWNTDDSNIWEELEQVFNSGPEYTVIAGHHHHYVKHLRDNHKHITLATTGGGSKMRGLGYGEFDHIVWLTMNDDGPLIANLLLDGIWDENLVTEEKLAFINTFNHPEKLSISPILFEGEIKSAKTSLRITNDFDVPLTVEFGITKKTKFVFNDQFPNQIIVNPNSVAKNEFEAEFPVAKSSDELLANIKWKASVPDNENNKIEINGELDFRMTQLLEGPLKTENKKIDGNLIDWDETFHEVIDPKQILGDASSWNGKEDGFYSFATAYDDEFVYIAVDVFDDHVISEKDLKPWEQDGIEIRLDARDRSISANGNGSEQGTKIMLLAISPNENANDEPWLSHQKDKLPLGTQYVCVRKNDGYAAEFAIPVSYFIEKQNEDWKDFRFNICIDDTDDDGFAQLWWQPSWREKENIAGSGIFLKR